MSVIVLDMCWKANKSVHIGLTTIGIHQSKKCEPPAALQMVPLGSPSAQAWGLSRGSAGAHKSDIIYF